MKEKARRGASPKTLLTPLLVIAAVSIALMSFVISRNILIFVGIGAIPAIAAARLVRSTKSQPQHSMTAAAASASIYAGVSFPVTQILYFGLGGREAAMRATGVVVESTVFSNAVGILGAVVIMILSIVIGTVVGWVSYTVVAWYVRAFGKKGG